MMNRLAKTKSVGELTVKHVETVVNKSVARTKSDKRRRTRHTASCLKKSVATTRDCNVKKIGPLIAKSVEKTNAANNGKSTRSVSNTRLNSVSNLTVNRLLSTARQPTRSTMDTDDDTVLSRRSATANLTPQL